LRMCQRKRGDLDSEPSAPSAARDLPGSLAEIPGSGPDPVPSSPIHSFGQGVGRRGRGGTALVDARTRLAQVDPLADHQPPAPGHPAPRPGPGDPLPPPSGVLVDHRAPQDGDLDPMTGAHVRRSQVSWRNRGHHSCVRGKGCLDGGRPAGWDGRQWGDSHIGKGIPGRSTNPPPGGRPGSAPRPGAAPGARGGRPGRGHSPPLPPNQQNQWRAGDISAHPIHAPSQPPPPDEPTP